MNKSAGQRRDVTSLKVGLGEGVGGWCNKGKLRKEMRPVEETEHQR